MMTHDDHSSRTFDIQKHLHNALCVIASDNPVPSLDSSGANEGGSSVPPLRRDLLRLH